MIWEFEDRLSSVCIDILCSFGTFSFHAVVNIYLRVTVKPYYRWWSILKSINADDTQTKVHQLHVSRIQMKFENEIDDYASDDVVEATTRISNNENHKEVSKVWRFYL